MELTLTHKLLIDRFIFETDKSLSKASIINALDSIMIQTKDSSNHNNILKFLLDIGVVDVCEAGRYSLCPSILIESRGKLFAVNLPLQLLTFVKAEEVQYKTINLIESSYKQLLIKKHGLPFLKFNVKQLLRKIPNLKTIVNLFQKEEIFELDKYQYYDYGWKTIEAGDVLGIYRYGNESINTKYIRVSQNEYFLIPHKGINPDAFFIALIYAAILKKEKLGICYNGIQNELSFNASFFPSIIIRILFINSGFNLDEIEDKKLRVFKNISYPVFNELNRIFMNKIQISYESI